MNHSMRMGSGWRGATGLIIALVALLLFAQTAFAQAPVLVQTYYVPVTEAQALASMDIISVDAADPVNSYVSIAIGTTGTQIYYDQFENGYESALNAPSSVWNGAGSAGTQIWGNGNAADGCPPNRDGVNNLTCSNANDQLRAGDVVVLRNAVQSTTPEVIDFDGRDKFGSTEQIAVSRVYWSAGNCGTGQPPGTCLAGAVEVYPTSDWGTTYVAPVGMGGIELVGQSVNSPDNTGSALTLSVPSGTVTGDILIAVLSWNNSTVAMAPASGWTQLYSTAHTSTGLRQAAFWRTVDGSEPASYDFATSPTTAVKRAGFMLRLRNAGTPTAAVDADNTGTANDAPSVNITEVGQLTLHVGSTLAETTRQGSTPDDFVELLDEAAAGTGSDVTIAASARSWGTRGATGVQTATFNGAAINIGAQILVPSTSAAFDFGDMFEYSSLAIQATQDDTAVTVDRNGPLSGGEVALTLQEGESAVVDDVLQGATVVSDFPVQVHHLTGDRNSAYEYSIYTLLPRSTWGPSYYSPVGTASQATTDSVTLIFAYNPAGVAPLDLRCDFLGSSVNYNDIPANSVQAVTVPAGSGAHCYAVTANDGSTQDSSRQFFAISTVDAAFTGETEGTAWDWGFTLIPDAFLSPQALVGLGIGQDPNEPSNTQNGSPIWVTPVCPAGTTGTWIYADRTGDGLPDVLDFNANNNATDNNVTDPDFDEPVSNNGTFVQALQLIKLHDHTDQDQTGMRIWSKPAQNNPADAVGCDLVVAWGENPMVASTGNPGFDVGTTVPPLSSFSVVKTAALAEDVDGDGFVTPGDVLTYTIEIKNTGLASVPSVIVTDAAPTNTTYQPGTTYKNTSGTTWTLLPDQNGTTALADGEELTPPVLGIGQTFRVRFRVQVNTLALCSDTVINNVQVRAVGKIKTAQSITPLDCPAKLTIVKQVVGPSATFAFTSTATPATRPVGAMASFNLTPAASGSAQSVFQNLAPRSYEVRESSLPANWEFTSVQCVNAAGLPADANSTFTYNGTRQAQVNLVEAGDVTCTYTNTFTAPEGTVGLRKTATPAYTRTFSWTIEKTVTPEVINLFDGENQNVTYTLTPVKTQLPDSGFQVSGSVVISNTSTQWPVSIQQPVDTLGTGANVTLDCGTGSWPRTLAPQATLTCSYSSPLANANDTTNTVVVTTTFGVRTERTVPVDFGAPTTVNNNAVDITDSNTVTVWSNITTPAPIVYTENLSCANVAEGSYSGGKASFAALNTAYVKNGQTTLDQDDATVTVNCYKLNVSKTAATTLTRTYKWLIEKEVNSGVINLVEGNTATRYYTVTVSPNGSETSNWAASGTITVYNPSPDIATLTSLSDTLPGVTVVVSGAGCTGPNITVPAAAGNVPGALPCSYTATGFTSGATLQNIATAVAYGKSYASPATPVDFSSAVETPVNDTVNITDTNVAQPLGQVTVATAPDQFSYTLPATCENATWSGDGTGTLTLPNTAAIVETGQQSSETVTINCSRRAALGDRVWYDSNNNGVQDGGEPNMANVTVNLYKATDTATVFATTQTNASGIYAFTNLEPGSYVVGFVAPTGLAFVTANVGDDAADSDAGANGQTAALTLTAGQVNNTVDAGLYTPATIEVVKTANQVQLPQPGANVTFDFDVTNTSASASLTVTELTDSVFGNLDGQGTCDLTPNGQPLVLAPGATYSCAIVKPIFLSPDAVAQLTHQNTVTVKGISQYGQAVIDTDDETVVVLCQGSAVQGTIFHDPNFNNTFDAGEFAWPLDLSLNAAYRIELPVSLEIRTANGQILQTLVTETVGGFYKFSNVPLPNTNGGGLTYTIRVGDGALRQFGYLPNSSSIDSAAMPKTCVPYVKDFGYGANQNGLIGDYFWYDTNVNGLQDEWFDANGNGVIDTNTGVFLLEQWEFVDLNDSGTADLPEELNSCGISSNGPNVRLVGPDGGTADRAAGITGYYAHTRTQLGTVVSPLNPSSTYTATVNPFDAKLTEGGLFWLAKDSGDARCKPVPVSSIVPQFPNGGAPVPLVININADGTAVAASITTASVTPAGEVGQCGVTTNVKRVVDLAATGPIDLSVDFATVCTLGSQTASVGNRTWFDTNPDGDTSEEVKLGDGEQNAGEVGAPGITVQLWSVGNNGNAENGGGDDLLAGTRTTDAQGLYNFSGVTPGRYYVVFINTLPSYVWVSFPNFDGNLSDTIDSDGVTDAVDPTRAVTEPFDLAGGTVDDRWDAGLVNTSVTGSSDLGDRVWSDVNKNGVQDQGEVGIPGVKVELYQVTTPAGAAAAAETLVGNTITDGAGIYRFRALDPGQYVVKFQLLTGFTISPTGTGTAATDNNSDVAGRTAVITLPAFTSDLTWDAGMYATPLVDPEAPEGEWVRVFLPTIANR